jgi:serine/threonine protein kinase
MSAEQRTTEELKFISTCVELELLQQTDAESLLMAINDQGGSVVQEAVRRGLLTPADVDIAQSLQYPTRVVPGYEILELIGRGGMGVVYRALQLDLERTVALKTILVGSVDSTTLAARFEREAKALARLQHPNIVQALNFGKHEGRYFFAMEFVSGRTCEQSVREQGFMPAESVWFIVRQVASGLMHALRQNLIHRDIKPGNLILTPPPEGTSLPRGAKIVKIADFGLAMFADQGPEQMKLTTGDKVMGSPAYMSLEQFGGGPVDFRTDMYALGATAWHLLFGKPPFQGGSVAAVFRQKSKPLVVDLAALPVVLPEDQMRLLLGLLDPDPNQRPQSYEQLIEAIDGLGVSNWVQDSPMSVQSEAVQRLAVSDQPTLAGSLPTPQADPIHDDLSQTVDLPAPPMRLPTNRRRLLIAAALLGVAAVVAVAVMQPLSVKRGPRLYTGVVDSMPLFDGVTLSGWDVGGSMVGGWDTVEAPDSSTAIACTTPQGALSRPIPETKNPRISLFVWLQVDGGPVDIDFAFDPSEPSDIRGCLRLSGSTNQLGEKISDFGELDVVSQANALPSVFKRYHVVRLERQPRDWFVFLEEQLIGTLPIERIGDGSAIRLVVHGSGGDEVMASQAFFADVQLDDLGKKEAGI